jgi:hypothetical protein
MTEPHNKGMKLSKPEYLGGGGRGRAGIIESGFAAYAPCWTDISGPT